MDGMHHTEGMHRMDGMHRMEGAHGSSGRPGTGGWPGTGVLPTSPPPLTWLYAPGDRPEVAAKALASGADVVVIDLEDAVAAHRKEYARAATAELLSERPPVPVHVRVNALDSPLAEADIRAVAALPGLSGLRLPKITSPDEVVRVAELAAPAEGGALPLYALLESALGVERAFAVASAHPALRGIALGEADLRADLGVRDDAGLDWARGRIVLAARAAGLAPPAQSVYPDVRDIEGLMASCAHGRALGFLGRMAIHPRQLPVIKRAYLPSPAEIASAEEILKSATSDSGALALPDGRFVDPAIVACAHRTLALAQHAG
ncbi:HpcH/HpaI aldolase/citrate lyase family protein [Streptomyces jeddahensis]